MHRSALLLRVAFLSTLVSALVVGCGDSVEEKCREAFELGCTDFGYQSTCARHGDGPCTDEADEAYSCFLDVLDEGGDACAPGPEFDRCRDPSAELYACDQATGS